MLLAKISSTNQAVSARASESVSEWEEEIRPSIIQGNACFVTAGKKLNAAKEALRGIQGSFGLLIEKLGLDQDNAEGLMRIAGHPLLAAMTADSVLARKIPHGWTVLAQLARIPTTRCRGSRCARSNWSAQSSIPRASRRSQRRGRPCPTCTGQTVQQ